MGGLYQSLGAYLTSSGTYDEHNRLWETLGGLEMVQVFPHPSAMQNRFVREPARIRAFRLLSEAKERHPEWVVKKLQKPLDDSPGV